MVAFTIGPVPDPDPRRRSWRRRRTIEADGADASTITVRLNDAAGRPHTTGGANVAVTSTLGTLSPVTDRGDGSYTATLTAMAAGMAVVGFAVEWPDQPAPHSRDHRGHDPAQTPPAITSPTDGAPVPTVRAHPRDRGTVGDGHGHQREQRRRLHDHGERSRRVDLRSRPLPCLMVRRSPPSRPIRRATRAHRRGR